MVINDFFRRILSLGLYVRPFDRRAYAINNFKINDLDSLAENNAIAIELRSIRIIEAVNYAEVRYYANAESFRSVLAVWIAIASLIVSVFVGVKGIRQAHDDSNSTTKAIVEALSPLKSEINIRSDDVGVCARKGI